MASRLDQARAAAKRARDNAKNARKEAGRRAAVAGTGYALGALETRGTLDRLPTVGDLPPATTVAAMALAAEMFGGPKLSAIAAGVADGAIAVAAHQIGSGGGVSGVAGFDPSGELFGNPTEIAGLGAGSVDEIAGAAISEYEEELDALSALSDDDD